MVGAPLVKVDRWRVQSHWTKIKRYLFSLKTDWWGKSTCHSGWAKRFSIMGWRKKKHMNPMLTVHGLNASLCGQINHFLFLLLSISEVSATTTWRLPFLLQPNHPNTCCMVWGTPSLGFFYFRPVSWLFFPSLFKIHFLK